MHIRQIESLTMMIPHFSRHVEWADIYICVYRYILLYMWWKKSVRENADHCKWSLREWDGHKSWAATELAVHRLRDTSRKHSQHRTGKWAPWIGSPCNTLRSGIGEFSLSRQWGRVQVWTECWKRKGQHPQTPPSPAPKLQDCRAAALREHVGLRVLQKMPSRSFEFGKRKTFCKCINLRARLGNSELTTMTTRGFI